MIHRYEQFLHCSIVINGLIVMTGNAKVCLL